MNRFHVHVRVDDIEKAIPFYVSLFGTAPTVVKTDYAKWMLEDPCVNFAISAHGTAASGIDHLGIQVESDGDLRDLAGRLKSAGETTRDEEAVTCCYAKGNKSWVHDPAGVKWETFFTFGEATSYGENRDAERSTDRATKACSAAPLSAKQPACCS
jgi:hypothetical protein